jgi:hypothetical protein
MRPGFRRFAIAAFAVLVPIAAHALWDHIEVRRLGREIAGIRERGEPVSTDDLRPWRPASEDEKLASRLYLAAAALAVDGSPRDRSLDRDLRAADRALSTDANLRATMAARLAAELSGNADAFTLLDKATALPFAAFHPGTDYSYRTSSLWRLADLSQRRSMQRCLAGDVDAAVASLISTVQLRRVEDTRFRLMGARPNGIPFVLSHCPPGAAAMDRIQQALGSETGLEAVSAMLMAERVMLLRAVWTSYGLDVRVPYVIRYRGWTPWAIIMRPWATHQLIAGLRDRARLLEAARQSAAARRAEVMRLESQARRWSVRGPGPVMPADTLPLATIPYVLDGIANTAATAAALAIERYRRANAGQVPASLDALVPAFLDRIPADPFDDAPIRFARRDDGYVIYAIGRDGKDDGGEIAPGPPPWSGGQPTPSKDVGVFIAVR